MFTGIVTDVGKLQRSEGIGGDRRLFVSSSGLPLAQMVLGESVAVNGVCLTLVEISGDQFAADVSLETLDCTTLGELEIGSSVNLERALVMGQPLGGHIVSGHVDAIGIVKSMREDARSTRFDFGVPRELLRYIAAKGSITIDGTSLTVNTVSSDGFSVNIIPHTMEHTVIASYRVGDRVNLEVDLIARYLERLVSGSAEGADADAAQSTLTIDKLRDSGML